MQIFLGADHAGFKLKQELIKRLQAAGYDQLEDVGAKTLDADDDYPHYAYSVASKILGAEDDDRGILICGSGQGMSMAANRVNGVRAALAWNTQSAAAAREDDNANVLVLPARFLDADAAWAATEAWLKAEFKADPKYQRRLDELEQLYG